MKFVYLLIKGYDWEDMTIIINEEEAIQASILYPNKIIEIFSKNEDIGYSPTYNYYKNGKIYQYLQ